MDSDFLNNFGMMPDWSPEEIKAYTLEDDPSYEQDPAPVETDGTPNNDGNDGTGNHDDGAGNRNTENEHTPARSESVGDNGGSQASEGAAEGDAPGSPVTDYATIVGALVKDGVLRTIGKDDIGEKVSAEDYSRFIEQEVQNRMDSHMRDVNNALQAGMQPDEAAFLNMRYNFFNNEGLEAKLDDEGDEGVRYRRMVIEEMCKLKGMSDEDAKDWAERSFESGKDKSDATNARTFCKNHYDKAFNQRAEQMKQQAKQEAERQQRNVESLKNDILKDEGLLKNVEANEKMRNEIFDYIASPQYDVLDADGNPVKDANGNVMKQSGLTKFIRENPQEYYKLVGTFLCLTKEGKDFSRFIKGAVSKEKKKFASEVANALNSTQFDDNGQMRYKAGVSQEIDELDISKLVPKFG